MPAHPSPRTRLVFAVASAAIAALAAAALVTAAALVPAPAAVLPALVVTCVGAPIVTAFELARAVAAVREPRIQLRRELDRIPETPHPLGY